MERGGGVRGIFMSHSCFLGASDVFVLADFGPVVLPNFILEGVGWAATGEAWGGGLVHVDSIGRISAT